MIRHPTISHPARIGAWLVLQLLFFFLIFPHLGGWLNQQTDVLYYFAAGGFALLSMMTVIPMFPKVSFISRVLITLMVILPALELLGSVHGLFSYF